MRNLKKLLALTLAMAMALSMMLTASAAVKYDDYTDKDSITAKFTEAVNVLTGLKVMQGDEKGFRPTDKITRAEAAAVIYRAVTGDVDNKQNDLYKDYGTFTDVKSDDWFAGYVGYCQNAGYIKGTTPTTFNPYGQVTGYEVLAMILRAVGYGKNNEFTGSSWQVNVAALARQLGVTRNVTAAHMEQTLNMAAPREVVADLVFMTIATVPTVTYTPALAYNDKQSVAGADSNIFNITLGQQVFGLFHDTTWQVIDQWGNPGYKWYKNGAWNGKLVTNVKGGKGYMIPANHPWYEPTPNTAAVATIKQNADYETTEQVRECDVAAALNFDGEKVFRLYVNQKTSLTDTYRVVATDTVTKVGGQGRLTKVYYKMENPWFTDNTDNHDMVVTMVDTMLALVTGKTDAKLDAAGHIITPAKLEVTIYDGMNTTQEPGTNGANALSNRVISKPNTSKDNWQYSKGDYILLNTYTNKTRSASAYTAPETAVLPSLGNNTVRSTQALLEEAAFTTNKVVTGTSSLTLTQGANVWIVDNGKDGIAESKQGKQTVTSWNTGKHQMDGTDYDDQICLFLDRAGRVTNTTFTWYFDQYGNIIGIGDAHAVNYGVITSIYSAQKQGESDTTGAVKAVATVKFADGTTGTVEIDRFVSSWGTALVGDAAQGTAADYSATPGTTLVTTGTQVAASTAPDASNNTIELKPMFDSTQHYPMTASQANPAFNRSAGSDVAATGWVYFSPSTVTNANAHNAKPNSWDEFGILYDNLFRFTVANDNAVVATEVAGSYTNAGGTWTANTLGYANTNSNFQRMANIVTSAEGELFKSLGYMSLQNAAVTNGTGAGTNYIYLNTDAQIMVRLNGSTTAINCYNGLSELPGNVKIPVGTEVDWTDTDGDGRADVVYIGNGNVPSTVTYGLFYYNGGVAQWDGASSTGTIAGYLNGEETTITFGNSNQFTTVQSSANYAAHLFALQFTNNIVSDVMVASNKSNIGANYLPRILAAEGTTYYDENGTASVVNGNATGVVLAFDNATTGNVASEIQTSAGTWDGTAVKFGLGTANGNPYNYTTEAIYLRDLIGLTAPTATNGISHVTYARDSLGSRIVADYWDYTNNVRAQKSFYLAPTCKVIGELEWLNISTLNCDVTMIYDTAAADAVTEIYISRDQDITPVTPKLSFSSSVLVDLDNITTQPALDTALKSLATGTIAYNDNVLANAAWTNSNAKDVLYFAFTCVNATDNASVEIRDASGTTRYYEATSSAGVGGHYFAVNINPSVSTANNANWIGGVGLTTGTYTYTVTVNGVPYSNTFTVIWG